MTDLARVRVQWTGAAVEGPSISTFYFDGITPNVGAVLSFFDAIKTYIPAGTNLTIPNAGDVLESTTGQIKSAWTASGGGVVTATGSAAFVRGSGLRVVWETGGVRNGRHVRGSTFIVPLVVGSYDTTGQVSTAASGAAQTAAGNLLTAAGGKLVVWSRPKPRSPASGVVAISSAYVPRNPTQLRSRRV